MLKDMSVTIKAYKINDDTNLIFATDLRRWVNCVLFHLTVGIAARWKRKVQCRKHITYTPTGNWSHACRDWTLWRYTTRMLHCWFTFDCHCASCWRNFVYIGRPIRYTCSLQMIWTRHRRHSTQMNSTTAKMTNALLPSTPSTNIPLFQLQVRLSKMQMK